MGAEENVFVCICVIKWVCVFMDVCVSVCGNVLRVGAHMLHRGVCVCACVEVNSSSPLCKEVVLKPSAQLLLGVCLQDSLS